MVIWNAITGYILKKSHFQKFIIFAIYAICLFLVLDYLNPDFKIQNISKNYQISQFSKDIINIYKQHNLKNECKKIFCELQDKNNIKQIELNFICENITCYESLKDIEMLARVYVLDYNSQKIDENKQKIRLIVEKDLF